MQKTTTTSPVSVQTEVERDRSVFNLLVTLAELASSNATEDYPFAIRKCYKRSREAACSYTERGRRYNTAKQKAESMRDKIDRLEDFVNNIRNARQASGNCDGRSNGGGSGDCEFNGAAADATITAATDEGTDRDLIQLTGKLNLLESGTRYVGGAHWESIMDDIADVKAYFELESNNPELDELDDSPAITQVHDTPSNTVLGISHPYSRRELLRLLPQKVEMDRLVATWFNVEDPIRLIVHAATFQKQYSIFWSDPRDVTPAWLALLYSVGCAGAQISGQARGDAATLALAEDLRRLTAHALVLADSVVPQPHVIEALMFYEKSLLLKNHDTLAQVWQIHGQVMRLCFHAGYHRDPGNNPGISPFDCEMRRRIWMLAVEYDVLCSYQLGLASLLPQTLCDTKQPSNLLDGDFSQSQMPAARPTDDYTLVLAGLCHGRLVAIFGDVMFSSHAIVVPNRADISALHDRLNSSRDSLPEKLKMIPLDQCFMDTPGQTLDRFRLELLYQKAVCVLYRRFLAQPGREDEHKRCLDAAEAVVVAEVPLLEAVQPGGHLATCTVYIYRHIHDFNLAAMILCSEIKRRSTLASEDDGGRTARVRPLMLQICSLWSMSHVVSPKARHAVKAIEKFLLHGSIPSASNGSSYPPTAAAPMESYPARATSSSSTSPPPDQSSTATGQTPTTTANIATSGVRSPSSAFPAQPELAPTAPDLAFPSSYEIHLPSPSTLEFQEAFNNIEQDPLFQEIFGRHYPDGEQEVGEVQGIFY